MVRDFRLPDLGEGVHEGEVLALHVQVGQRVTEGDVVLEVETDKAAVEIPAPVTGVITAILVSPGDTVKTGAVMLRFEVDDSAAAQTVPVAAEIASSPDEAGSRSVTGPPPPADTDRGKTPVPASPSTRRLARELGVDLRQVAPTGHGGVVTADDVRAWHAAAGAGVPAETPSPVETQTGHSQRPAPQPTELAVKGIDFSRWGPVERVPLRSLRRATATRMATAWAQIPHVSNQAVIDVTRLEAFRQRHKTAIEAAGGRLTFTVFALKAAAAVLKRFPRFNATLDMDRQEIIHKQYYHIGVAVNTDEGLIVPVIRDVDRKSIEELSIELRTLVARTRERKISRDALQGGSFTITNAGALGGGFFTPIINYPEVAILGMGRAAMQPVAKSEGNDRPRIVARLLMPAVLCFDHRVADGAEAIAFLDALRGALEDPDELLMMMT